MGIGRAKTDSVFVPVVTQISRVTPANETQAEKETAVKKHIQKQAEVVLDEALKYIDGGYEKVAIVCGAYSNEALQLKNKNFAANAIKFSKSAHQIPVLIKINDLLENDPNYQRLKNKFDILPITVKREDNDENELQQQIERDLTAIKKYLTTPVTQGQPAHNAVMGWQDNFSLQKNSSIKYAIGGSKDEGLRIMWHISNKRVPKPEPHIWVRNRIELELQHFATKYPPPPDINPQDVDALKPQKQSMRYRKRIGFGLLGFLGIGLMGVGAFFFLPTFGVSSLLVIAGIVVSSIAGGGIGYWYGKKKDIAASDEMRTKQISEVKALRAVPVHADQIPLRQRLFGKKAGIIAAKAQRAKEFNEHDARDASQPGYKPETKEERDLRVQQLQEARKNVIPTDPLSFWGFFGRIIGRKNPANPVAPNVEVNQDHDANPPQPGPRNGDRR